MGGYLISFSKGRFRWSYRRILVTFGVRRRLGLLPDGFDTVDELYSLDELGHLVMPVEAAPALLGRLGRA